MIKKSLTLLSLSLMLVSAFAQNGNFKPLSRNKKHRCYTVEIQDKFLKSHPNAETPAQFEGWLQSKIAERKRAISAQGKKSTFGTVTQYTLPIVFHIVHNGEAVGTTPNVSASFIQAQLLQLNKDYANMSGSPYSVSSSTGIQFALATQDPNGKTLAEPGIDRVNRVTKKWGAAPFEFSTTVTDTIKPATIWDPYRYVNVWLLEDVTDGGSSGILGIATLPASSVLDGLDNAETDTDAGVVIGSGTVGSIFSSASCGSTTNPYTLGRTLTHELGHFFGLRHIWGDSTCATDYCDDTPIHHDMNFGKPKHPKPNTCGTFDEMFEDYMDYTDDDVMNTFTANQADRMQTVMLSSPRRMTLATSNVPTVIPTGSNKLSFAICSGELSVPETGNAGVTQRYKDETITLNVEKVATATATVYVNATGTAKKGIDYELINDTLSFAKNDGAKSFTLRILDNNAIDGDRTVILSYSIVGTGVVAATNGQSLTVTIQDDDSKIIGNKPISLLNENFGTIGGKLPTSWTKDSTSGSPNFFVVGSTTNPVGTGQFAYVTNNKTTKALAYTKSANADNYSVLTSPKIAGIGYKSIDTLKFKYKAGGQTIDNNAGTGAYGSVNYTMDVNDYTTSSFYNDSFGTAGCAPYLNATQAVSLVSSPVLSTGNFYIHFIWEAYYTKSGKNPGLCIDDVSLNATPFAIDSSVSNSYTLYVPATKTNLVRSTNDDIIASVSAATSPVKNFVASITEAGASKVDFLVDGKSYQRSKKVVTFSNGTTDTTSTYTTTLYYTTNEVEAWSSILKSIKVLQLKKGTTFSAGDISLGNAAIITPTSISDKRTASGYVAITFSSKGLGSFALIDSTVALPITWKYFTGKVQNNAAVLAWQLLTATKGVTYTVERSVDGIKYTAIQSGLEGTSFTDATIDAGKNYYYRVIATTTDGSVVYSSVINVVYFSLNHSFTVAPNPFSNVINISNNGTATGVTFLSVFDVTGREIYAKSFPSQQGVSTINTASWVSGVYVVKIKSSESAITYKLIKR